MVREGSMIRNQNWEQADAGGESSRSRFSGECYAREFAVLQQSELAKAHALALAVTDAQIATLDPKGTQQ